MPQRVKICSQSGICLRHTFCIFGMGYHTHYKLGTSTFDILCCFYFAVIADVVARYNNRCLDLLRTENIGTGIESDTRDRRPLCHKLSGG